MEGLLIPQKPPHCKKSLEIFSPQPGCHQPNYFFSSVNYYTWRGVAGNNLIIPDQGEFG
jgi:hypothetical protein